jgi:hypothetical protein
MRLCALFLLCTSAFSAEVQVNKLAPEIIRHRLERVTRKIPDRRATLEALFHDAGCNQLAAQPVPHSKESNLICTLDGETTSQIVVGGHFDLANQGIGAVDDWSGAALLPSLYQSLAGKARRHRFVFVGFAAEERGLYGSREYVARLSPEAQRDLRAMINLECLGLSPVKAWTGRADKALLNAYIAVSRSLGVAPEGVDVSKVGDDDSHPFLAAHIPVLTLHSLTRETLPILHSTRDQLTAIDPDFYYGAYRIAATYLAYLDTVLP